VAIDLADYSKSKEYNDGYSYIFVAVDYFTKYVFAKALKTKQSGELAEALVDMISHWSALGKPEAIISDQEGGTQSPSFIRVLNEHHIRHIITSTPNSQAERTIQTIKHLLHKRIVGLNLPHERWVDFLPKVVRLYNEKNIHNTIGMTPREAMTKENKLQVYINIKNKANFKKIYPPLHESDRVRIAIKKSAFTKGYHPTFSHQVYNVIAIKIHEDGSRAYLLDAPNQKLYQRHELLRVSAAENKDTR
jgi:hypothetical protein